MKKLKLENNEILLTTQQVADLYKTARKTVTNWVIYGKLKAVTEESNKGRGGISYLIPLSALDEKAKKRYWRSLEPEKRPCVPENKKDAKPLDMYSEDERKVIGEWIRAIREWQKYRLNSPLNLKDADKEWVDLNQDKYKNIGLSLATLYRRWKSFKENDYDGLIEKRGKWAKGKSTIPEAAWEVFKHLYLDENQLQIKVCHMYTMIYFEKEMPELLPEIPGYDAFYRAVKTIPFAVVKYFREGDKAFEDEAAPYITRMYEDIEVGEVWVADSHTLDIMTIENSTEKIHRMTVISFMDVRSRLITGWYITNNPSSEGVLYALRKGIMKYGIPKYIYVDNGNEFLCFDIGGRGHRTRKSDKKAHIPPGVFERLGIEMWNAQVRNAKAKTIERTHREFKDKFSRLIKGFCGGNPLEKPENLKKTLKSRKGMLLDSQLIEHFNLYIEGMYNETPSKGMGMDGRSPIEVYNEELLSKRTAKADDLNLMLMRSTRMQKVGRKGVYLEISGERLYYWSTQFKLQYESSEVYLRYDPEDLRTVRVYNEQDNYLCSIPVDNETILKYGSSKDAVKKAISKIKSFKKTVKAYNDNSILETMPKIDVLDLMIWKSSNNIEQRQQEANVDAKVLEVVRANEPASHEIEAVQEVTVDYERMIRNSKRNAM